MQDDDPACRLVNRIENQERIAHDSEDANACFIGKVANKWELFKQFC